MLLKYTIMTWIKTKISKQIKSTNCKSASIRRDYKNDRVTIDYFGGACVKYSYAGKWICG
jgi:hypothetical protein